MANKSYMSYDFNIRHVMHAVGWRLLTMSDKDENLIENLDRTKRQSLIQKFSYVPISDT